MRYACLFVFLLMFPGLKTLAQKSIADSVHPLKGAEITGFRSSSESSSLSGIRSEIVDTTAMNQFQNNSLDDLLMQRTSVYVKSNGVSGLSSISIRGTGTSHTAVLWNGFNLQNTMNGGMDFSLLPVGFSDKITVRYSGLSALFGSGTIGGAVQLDNIPEFNRGYDISIGGNYGSFANYGGDVRFNWSNKKVAVSLKTFYHQGLNNFPFTNTARFGSPKVRQTNADISQYAAMLDNAFNINDKNLLTLRFWVQTADRNIPPVMTQEITDAHQTDASYRTALEWKNEGKIHKLYLRSALFVEDYAYTELSKTINSTSRAVSSISEGEVYLKVFPYHTLNIGLHYKYTYGLTDYYQGAQHQQEGAMFVSYLMQNKNDKWRLNLSFRQEYANNKFVPPMPSVGMDLKIYDEMLLFANVNRNFRLPTLNDLYWYPGGNPDLKPESGFSEEIGLKQEINWRRIKCNYIVSVFNNNVTNWIVWLPAATFWSPQNIQSVWSRGGDAFLDFAFNHPKTLIDISGKLSYVKATTRKSNNQSAIGKQLIYTPEVNASINLSFGFKRYLFSYNMEYVSLRYTSPDNSDKIEPYLLGNIQLSKEFRLKKFAFSGFVHINNIWNQTYQTIAWQAMPGINIKTGIKINFKYKPDKINKNEKI